MLFLLSWHQGQWTCRVFAKYCMSPQIRRPVKTSTVCILVLQQQPADFNMRSRLFVPKQQWLSLTPVINTWFSCHCSLSAQRWWWPLVRCIPLCDAPRPCVRSTAEKDPQPLIEITDHELLSRHESRRRDKGWQQLWRHVKPPVSVSKSGLLRNQDTGTGCSAITYLA